MCVIFLASLAIVVFVYVEFISINDYSIHVDPLKDLQDLFTMSRISIQNTGKYQLTDIRINFGNNYIEKLGIVLPKQKILVAPPPYLDAIFIVITINEGISVTKTYRTPTKIPGMMGS